MALPVSSITALNTWSSQESVLLPTATPSSGVNGIPAQQVLQLGSYLNNGLVLADVLRNNYQNFNFAPGDIPAVTAAAVTATLPLTIPAFAGNVALAQFVSSTAIIPVTSNLSASSLVLRKTNVALTATFGWPVPIGSGLTANAILIIPTGSKNTLLSNNVQYSLTASGMNVTFNVVTAGASWVFTPAPGDYVMIDAYATNYTASGINVASYLVNAATPSYIYMSKQSAYSTTVNSVGSITCAAADIATISTVGQYGAAFSPLDILSLQLSVPAGSVTTAQNLGGQSSLLQLTMKPSAF
jgi:hypothetical protein